MSFVLEVKIRIKPDQVDNFMTLLAENAKGAEYGPRAPSKPRSNSVIQPRSNIR